LELIYQHQYQGATMTCAMDWIYNGDTFYDWWVSRSIVGNIFFELTQGGSYDHQDNLFWDDPVSKGKFDRLQPLQVYSCWNGAVVLDAKPFIEQKLGFRSSDLAGGECFMGEPTLLCKDMWRQGIARVQVVPTVNLGYSNEEVIAIKRRRGYVADHIDTSKPPEERQAEPITWEQKPPGHLKCLPWWDKPSWVSPV